MGLQAYQQYQRVQTETASPGDLVLMLYRGALRFLTRAETALEKKEYEVVHSSLVRAQDIVLELMFSLDLQAGDVARNLRDLYNYMYQRLVDANCNKDAATMHEVSTLLRELLPAWEDAVAQVAAKRTPKIGSTV